MNSDKIPFNAPAFAGNEMRYIKDAIARGQLSGDGYYTQLCNTRISDLSGGGRALLTHSCTAALEMAAILAGIGPGDEVIMPSFTFVSTANAVALRGGVPVFVDIRPDTLNIDPVAVSSAVTSRTRAIMAVHYAGFPAEMDLLSEIARDHGVLLIEDAAQALGARFRGRPAGSLGDLACFSFHETKNVISGEGGALVVNRLDLSERAEIIREKGTNRSRFLRGQVDKYTWVDIGSSFLPGELIASFLYAQLEEVEAINARRRAYFSRYLAELAHLASRDVGLPAANPDSDGNGHMFYILARNAVERGAFIEYMSTHRVACPFHYVPLHCAPYGQKVGRSFGDLPVTTDIASRLVRLPLFSLLGAQQDRVIDLTLSFFKS